MSTETNKNVVRAVIEEAFNKGNLDVLDGLFAPGYAEHQFGIKPTLEGMKKDIQSLRRSLPDLHLTIEDMIAESDKVWVRSTARGTNLGGFFGAPDGKSIEITVYDSVRLENGKIVEHWGVPDRFAVLAQLGKLPQPGKMAQPEALRG
jgi:predicted ester cyclase